ncbi:myristoyl transferase [bacterium]|nr:myristoyl transferase [bacterium]
MPRLRLAIVLCLSAWTLWGCGASSDQASNGHAPDVPAEKLTPITLGLNWFPEAEHGGYYAALHHGYYREAGFDVTILPGGPKSPVLQQVASGQVDFAVDNADKLLLVRAQQADLVAVFSPIQNSPRCVMVHAESGITSLEQLAQQPGYTLAMNPGQPFSQFLSKKLDLKSLTITAYPGNVVQFLLDPKFAQQAYSFSEPFVAEQQGAKVTTLMLSDLGFNTYTSLLITSHDRIEQQPETVAAIVAASRKGWQKYLESPAETNALIHQRNPEMGLDVLEFGVRDLQLLCLPEGMESTSLGQMEDERWSTLVEQMVDSGSLDPQAVQSQEAYTLQFLEQPTPAVK